MDPSKYSVKHAAVSLFVGVAVGACCTLAVMVTMSLVGVNSLPVYDGVAMLGWGGGVAYAGYRAAEIQAHAGMNAYIICVLVLVLFIASIPAGTAFTESFKPFPDQWKRVIMLSMTLPAVLIGVHIRSKRGSPPSGPLGTH